MTKLKNPKRPDLYKKPNIHSCNDLMDQLLEASQELDFCCRANLPVKEGEEVMGYGVEQKKKDDACDHLVNILNDIKKLKGW